MKTVAILGECMIELNGEPFGAMWQSYGGDTLNTATYLARLTSREQLSVRYVSAVGTDKLSAGMLARWQADGLDTSWVLRDAHRQLGLYLIQLDAEGERTFLYWRNQSAARYLLQHIDYPNILSQLSNVDMIYLSGISLAILPKNDRLLLLQQLAELAKQGVEIAFDSNYRANLWQSIEETRQIYTALLPYVSLALVTFDDEQALWQDENSQATLQRLQSLGVKNIIVKQGKCGAIFQKFGEQPQLVPTKMVEKVVDSTSAGDAFNAGFLAGYLQGKDFVKCCQQGNEVAGVVIQHKGAIIAADAMKHLHY
ncbi:MAG: sugar kinase [Pasteurella oralis]|uniref:sugar kinase n=1 Tax=Pasteurella oralis TaxID=1071947 RepID=UPI002710949E|nr:sugar kinase [Pasteurella oralis]